MKLDALNPDFRDLLIALADFGVEFLIVGAYALAAHGVPRTTGDIDVFVRPSKENAAKVFDALERFGAPLEAAGVRPADFTTEGMVYQIGLPPRRIDVLTRISGVSFDQACVDRIEAEIDSRQVFFIGRDALLMNKRAAARPKDLVDVAILEKKQR